MRGVLIVRIVCTSSVEAKRSETLSQIMFHAVLRTVILNVWIRFYKSVFTTLAQLVSNHNQSGILQCPPPSNSIC
jgi:hypothetical protein